MKKQLFTTWLISLLCISAFQANASEAQYNKLHKSYTLNADGSQEFRYNMELTLFTHTAMNSTYGESFIVYNPEWQELKFHSSYTIQKDGNRVETPENAFVEVLPRAAANAPAYNHLKEMVVVHTGLELGATIYLDYSIYTKPGYLPELDLFEELKQTSPVKEYKISLTVPETKPLFYTMHVDGARLEKENRNGMQSLTWTILSLPAASRAPGISIRNGDVPYMAASTFATEAIALAGLKDQFNPAKDRLQFQTFAEALTEGKSTDTQKMLAILEYVNTGLDNSALSLKDAGYRVRPLSDVTASAYATEAEKINMLATLLTALNLDATVVAAYRVKAEEGSLGLSGVENLFVIAKTDGKTYYLNAYNDKPCTVIGYAKQVPLRSFTNGAIIDINPLPSDIKLQADITIKSADEVDAEIESHVGSLLSSYNSTIDLKNKKQLELNKQAAGYAIFTLPDVALSTYYSSYPTFNTNRTERLSLPYPVKESYSYTINIPSSVQLRTPEVNQLIENEVGKAEITIRKQGNKVKVTRSLELKTAEITPEMYKDFRQLMNSWGNTNSKTLLFKFM